MSDVYEIYAYKWDSDTEIMHIEAEVSDSVLACRATQYEPEQWTHGRCTTSFLWPDDGEATPTEQNIFEYINNNSVIEWELIPLENFFELTKI